MISQDFMGEHRSICRYGGHWMNFPSGENPGFVIVTDVAERVLSCVVNTAGLCGILYGTMRNVEAFLAFLPIKRGGGGNRTRE
jgi:hypothetical protein